MQANKTSFEQRLEAIAQVLLWVIIVIGIGLRISVYLQNRDLIIDEVNIARNLYERSYLGLLQPLDYEQYAPPVFLWIEELSTRIFGFGEMGMKLYPLITGIAALFVMRKVLLKLMPARAAWLPLLMMSVTYWYINYSTCIKQYMPDTMIALILVWLALTYDIDNTSRKKFIAIWGGVGTLVIWSSMPSVFVLAGVGCYYGLHSVMNKWKGFGALVLIAIIWLANFGLFYELMLKAQVGLPYLQNYHKNYFLIANPQKFQEWQHNWSRLKEILMNMGGFHYYAWLVSVLFVAVGGFALLFRRPQWFILVLFPVMFTFIAAAMKQFSLIERVILFMMPLLLITLGYGVWQFMQLRFKAVQVLAIIGGIYIISHYNEFQFFYKPLITPEFTKGMEYLDKKGAKGNQVYVHDATRPTYLYYTQIHPNKEKWAHLQGANLLNWDDHYAFVMRGQPSDTGYFFFTGGMGEVETARRDNELNHGTTPIDSFMANICKVKVCIRKPDQ
jgi:hypothetical protein